MAEVYHIKIKKEYSAALIDGLIKVDAEDMELQNTELPQWQKVVVGKELQAIAENIDYTIAWNSVKSRFK